MAGGFSDNTAGYELIRRMRALSPRFQQVPAIAVTAYAEGADRNRALEAGLPRNARDHVGLKLEIDQLMLAGLEYLHRM